MALAAVPASAGSTKWTGGTSDNWADSANWSSGVPTNGEDVTLAPGTNYPSNFNINVTLNSLELDTPTGAAGYTITNGGGFTLGLESGGFILDKNTKAVDQINTGLTLNGPATITLDTSAQGLSFGDGTAATRITGTGGLTVTDNSGTGLIQFLSANDYTGGTTISAGTLQLGSGGTTGSITGDVLDNAKLVFNRSDGIAFSGAISGTGLVAFTGGGSFTLSNATNSYAGGTLVHGNSTLSISQDSVLGATAGGLSLGDATTNGTLAVTSSFSLAANRAVTLGAAGGTIAPSLGVNFEITQGITGGPLTKSGAGTLILSGNNLYSGTTIASGTLQLGDGGTSGSLTGDVTDNATLAFNRSDDNTFANAISGTGNVVKLGTNALTLTGTNSYQGGTIINGGTLSVGADANLGDPAGTLQINNGSTLQLTNGFSNSRHVTLGTGEETIAADAPVSFTTTVGGNGTAGDVLDLNFNQLISGPPIHPGPTVTISYTSVGGESAATIASALEASAAANATLSAAGFSFGVAGDVITANVATPWVESTSTTATPTEIVTNSLSAPVERQETLLGSVTGNDVISQTYNTTGGPVTLNYTVQPTDTLATVAAGLEHAAATNATLSADGFTFGVSGDVVTAQADQYWTVGTLISGAQTEVVGTTLDGTIARDTLISGAAKTGDVVSLVVNPGISLPVTLSYAVTASDTTASIATALESLAASNATLSSDHFTFGVIGSTISEQAALEWSDASNIVPAAPTETLASVSPTTFDTFSGVIDGAGELVKTGITTTLVLTGTDTYQGGTWIKEGALSIGSQNGGTTGSIIGDVTDDGELFFNRTDDTTFAGSISGVGQVSKFWSGTLILTGTNTYMGGTSISDGTLQLGDGVQTTGTLSDIGGVSVTVATSVLAFDHPNDLTYGGSVTGAGQLKQIGTGTLTLTGTNAYTGGTFIVSGALQIGNGGTTGSIIGNVADATTFIIDRSDTITLDGVISGNGALQQIGIGGTTVLTGNDTYKGGTTIASNSTLQLGNGGTSGVIVGDVTDNGTLVVDRSDTIELDGTISGATGTLKLIGTGTTVLTGNNSYGGGTAITSGTLQIGNGGASGSIGGVVADNGTLAFDRSDTALNFAGAISGLGSVAQIGTGTTTLSGNNGYLGGTTISAGTLSVAAQANLGTGPVTITNGTLAFSASGGFSLAARLASIHDTTLSGTPNPGDVVTLTITPPASAAIAVAYTVQPSDTLANIAAGLQAQIAANSALAAAGFSATALGAVLSVQAATDWTTSFNVSGVASETASTAIRADTSTFDTGANAVGWSGTITGGAGNTLTKQGSGTLTLTGNNTYTGTTSIAAGTLQIGNGGTSGVITGNVADNGTLAFDRSDKFSFAGTISGNGAVDQNGSGTLTLSGTNTYGGGTNLNFGTLSISSDANLGNGGTFALAAGTTVDITAGGTYAHTVTLTGDPTFSVTPGQTVTWTAPINDGASPGTLEVAGGGTFNPTNTSSNYSGGTVVRGNSTLSIAADTVLGAPGGGVTLGDATTQGTLAVTASFSLAATRPVTVAAGGGTIAPASGVTFEITQAITGSGALTKSDAGTLVLSGNNSYGGGTTIAAGTLQLGDGNASGSVTGNILDNGTLAFDRSDSFEFDGLVSGTGAIVQSGTGTTILTANNTVNGTTTISFGTLQLGNGGATGAVAGPIVDNGVLAVNQSGTVTLAAISGSGAFMQNGTGTTIFAGNNTYGGGTTISAGTLQLGNGGTSGSVTGDILDNATLAFDRSDSVTVAGLISGSGAVQQNGTGTTILTADNTYGGGTTITAGALQLGNGTASGSVQGSITDNGTLAIDRSDVFTPSNGAIGGSGSLAQIGTGTTVLVADNTYGGGTTITAGTLQLGNGGTTGSIKGDVLDNALLAFDRSDSVTFAGAISGTGGLNQIGAGTLVLTGTNSYAGTTTISSGTLQVGDGGADGSLGTGAVVDNAALIFNRSDSVTVSGGISGSGSLEQAGSGTTILASTNTYGGGTKISAGTLQIGNGAGPASITGDVLDNGTLAFDVPGSQTFAGVISGSGGVSQFGSGTLLLSATHTYTGLTQVAGGTLVVNGSIVSSSGAVVASGATIAGTGTLPKLSVLNGGAVAPGNIGVGTLVVHGNLAMSPSATYAFDASLTGSDFLNVSGTASIGGTLAVMPHGQFAFGSNIPVLTAAGGVTGTFSSVDVLSSFGPDILATVSYDAKDAFLTLVPAEITPFLPSNATSNEKGVAAAIDFANGHDNAIMVFAPLGNLAPADLNAVLTELSGEVSTGVQNQGLATMGAFLGDLLNPSIGGRGDLGIGGVADARAYTRLAYNGPDSATPLGQGGDREVSLWGTFTGDRSTTDGNPALGTHDISGTQAGGEVGLDYRPGNNNGAVGVAAGYAEDNWKLASGALGKGRASAYEGGVYYSRRFDDNYVAVAATYGSDRVTTDRTVNFGGTNAYRAKFTTDGEGAQLEFGHLIRFDDSDVSPYALVRGVNLNLPAYTETTVQGSPLFALSFAKKDRLDYSTEIGAAADRTLFSGDGSAFDAHIRLGWQHETLENVSADAVFASFPGAGFTVNGAPPPKDAAHAVLGFEQDFENLALTLSAEGLVARNSQTYTGSGGVSFRW